MIFYVNINMLMITNGEHHFILNFTIDDNWLVFLNIDYCMKFFLATKKTKRNNPKKTYKY
ncbi:hypothetical protein DERF_012145 [Dermatophagoides farinae]|uniref:Uncharacterized protein n=1 Tax=Dermatophagoides farinae TaxID=6954 RepID=A0A922KXX3_DERFA|nr:hypothetical protein DERF_012145 [Dermatophagoides farinae]